MRDNYKLQVQQATKTFLRYDRNMLIAKHNLAFDEDYLYTELFSQRVRIDCRSGQMQVFRDGWVVGDRFGLNMTVMDLLCDSKENRRVSGKMMSMASFGLQFHSGLSEQMRSRDAEWMQAHFEEVKARCEALGGQRVNMADVCYDIPVFQDLKIRMQLWFADDEFPAKLSWFWDENALDYLHYETMYYAVGYLMELITGKKER